MKTLYENYGRVLYVGLQMSCMDISFYVFV